MRRTIGIHANQIAKWIIFARRVIEPRTGKEASLGIGDAIVHLAFCAIGFHNRKAWFVLAVPLPDSLRVDHHKPAGFVESISGDLESGLDQFVLACLQFKR